jgi:hypothetical protein
MKFINKGSANMEQRKRLWWPLAAAFGMLLTACGALQVTDGTGTTQPLGQWLEGWKPSNVMAQKAAVSAQAASAAHADADPWSASKGCRVMPDFALGTDIDSGYARAMRRFSFYTEDRMQRLWQLNNDIPDGNFRHERQPGAYYHLAQSVKYPDAGMQRAMWLDLTLTKDGARNLVSAKYCLIAEPDPNAPARHQVVQRYIVNALTSAQ